MLYIQSVIVYTLLALVMCFGAYQSQSATKPSRLLGWIPVILFTLVMGFRYGVGVDYNNYAEIYEETETYRSFSELNEDTRFEIGFLAILYSCHLLGLPIWSLFSILAFLQIFLIYKTFKYEDNILPYIYATLIFTGICVYSFMNIMRHAIAFCFFLYSLKFIRDNKLIKYWLCCLLAMAFHKSALLLFPLYFIWIRSKSLLNAPIVEMILVVICFLGSFVSSWQNILHLFDNAIVFMGYEDYVNIADEMTVNSKIGITRILNLIVTMVIIMQSRKIKAFFNSRLLDIIYDLYVVGVCLSFLFLGSMMLGRIIVYFSLTQFIILAYAICYLSRSKRQSVVQLAAYTLIVFTLFINYSSFIYNCKKNTGAYVSYFQTDLHDEKDNLREEMISNITQ